MKKDFGSEKEMKRSTMIFAGILLFVQAVSADEKNIMVQEYPLTEVQKQNRHIVKLAAEEFGRNLPQKVDNYTTLIQIKGKDTTLIYIFEINTGAKSDEAMRKEDRTRMLKAVTNGVCQSSKRFLDAHINISYIYRSAKSKEELFRFTIKREDCDYFE